MDFLYVYTYELSCVYTYGFSRVHTYGFLCGHTYGFSCVYTYRISCVYTYGFSKGVQKHTPQSTQICKKNGVSKTYVFCLTLL